MSKLPENANNGYWLIEIDELSPLVGRTAWHDFARCALAWISQKVSTQLDLPAKEIMLTVIDVSYEGTYPCLAAKYAYGPVPSAIADSIVAAIRECIGKTTLLQLLNDLEFVT